MLMKNTNAYITLKAALLVVTAAAAFYFYIAGSIFITFIAVIQFIVLLIDFIRIFFSINKEINQFAEAVRYRDFSQHFNERKAPPSVRNTRKAFNVILNEFRKLSVQKEAQFQYLQKVLEIVDTGIITFDTKTEEIIWMNQYFRDLLSLPNFKKINFLKDKYPSLYEKLIDMKTSKSDVISISANETPTKFLVNSVTFFTEEKESKLVSIQNLKEVLDITESEAWEKLLRVLTHEIMNSVAPISSLADTIEQKITTEQNIANLSDTDITDLQTGISTIKKRSDNLLYFAESYRSLNKISSLTLSPVYVRDIFETLITLLDAAFEKENIDVQIVLKDTNIKVNADAGLVEQALLNLLLNAMEAVKESEHPEIILSADYKEKKVVEISVHDNGKGISQAVIDKIFIPFFSTRKSGSGIGLSLCKQIMLLHKGTISVQSSSGKGTTFRLIFNA